MNTFDGFIKEFPNVCVDYFGKANLKCTAFFLSHCHTDHMKGLKTENFMTRLRSTPDVFIYCSEVTKTVIVNNGLYDVQDKIKVLSASEPTMIQVPQSDCGPLVILVSIIPSDHYPGSVMFLFEGSECNVLYTGDFRLAHGESWNLMQLHSSEGVVKRIDSMYLDTTFFDKTYTCFPSRQTSFDVICWYIKQYLSHDENCHVSFDVPAKCGSEYLLINVARVMKMKIHIPEDQFQFYRSVPGIGDFVTDSCLSTRIHSFFSTNALEEQFIANGIVNPTVKTIEPCAFPFEFWSRIEHVIQEVPELNLLKVCCSNHCAYLEVKDVIWYFNPETIIPCVPANTEKVTSLIQEICDANVRIQQTYFDY